MKWGLGVVIGVSLNDPHVRMCRVCIYVCLYVLLLMHSSCKCPVASCIMAKMNFTSAHQQSLNSM